MGNPIATLPLNLQNLRQLISQNSNTSQPSQNVNIPQQTNNLPTNPFYNLAIKNLQDYANKTQQFPDINNYKPSKLRRILGDVGGGLSGVLSLNPLIGERMANTIKDEPYLENVRKYKLSMIPFQQRANLGMQEAQLGNQGITNLLGFLRAQSAASEANSAAIRSRRPVIGRTGNINVGGKAYEISPTEEFNPNTNDFDFNEHNLGRSNIETSEERNKYNEDRIKELRDAAILRYNASRYAANLRNEDSTANRAQQLSIHKSSLYSHLFIDQVPPSDQKVIMENLKLHHPELMQSVVLKGADGKPMMGENNEPITAIVPKNNLTPAQMKAYDKAFRNEIMDYSTKHNLPWGLALGRLDKSDNPLLVKERDSE